MKNLHTASKVFVRHISVLYVNEKIATDTFGHNTWRTKTYTTLVKTYRKVLKYSNLVFTMSLAQGQILKHSFPCA